MNGKSHQLLEEMRHKRAEHVLLTKSTHSLPFNSSPSKRFCSVSGIYWEGSTRLSYKQSICHKDSSGSLFDFIIPLHWPLSRRRFLKNGQMWGCFIKFLCGLLSWRFPSKIFFPRPTFKIHLLREKKESRNSFMVNSSRFGATVNWEGILNTGVWVEILQISHVNFLTSQAPSSHFWGSSLHSSLKYCCKKLYFTKIFISPHHLF